LVGLLTCGNYLIAIGLSSIHAYAVEIYPTRMRAFGAGTAMAWLRIAQIVSPLIVGALLGGAGVDGVFLFLTGIRLQCIFRLIAY
jgi:putative MFS transporter